MLKGGRVQKNVVLISPRLVLPNELQKDITIVDFDLPDYRDIKQSLISIINANRGNTKIHFNLDEAGVDNLAKAAQGLTLQEAENAFARAMIERGCLDQDSVDIIVEEKRQIIKKTGVRQLPATEVASLRESFDTSICLDRPGLLYSQSCEVQQRSGNYQSH